MLTFPVNSSHDRAFLDAVATDIVHQHNQRLDYYKGNFSQFYATKTERAKNQKKEYEAQLQYRQHLQVRCCAACGDWTVETASDTVPANLGRRSLIDGGTMPTEVCSVAAGPLHIVV
jgi:hypothetical protein